MFLVNFRLKADVIANEKDNDKFEGIKKTIALRFDREYELKNELEDDELVDERISIRVEQTSGLMACVTEIPSVELKEGTSDHALLNELIKFMERWCLQNNPFD